MKATFFKHTLQFITPGKTSRNTLLKKDSWFLVLKKEANYGIGECSIIRGLSLDNSDEIDLILSQVCEDISRGKQINNKNYHFFPAIKFAIETAFKSLENPSSSFQLFNSDFTNSKKGIKVNGLIWMGDIKFMKDQIKIKLENGFNCLKLKVGALEFQSELELLRNIRKEYSNSDLEIRLDANGAFSKDEAIEKLKKLSEFSIHSVEQPIMPKQLQEMANICEFSPISIALDEELIGIHSTFERQRILDIINPHFLIIKPSLLGGFNDSDNWIEIAEEKKINWWATSALESNLGLNAIAQWVSTKKNNLRQGLGTGMLFSNNIQSPLEILKDEIFLNANKNWDSYFFKKNI